jgi:hypothetical protein
MCVVATSRASSAGFQKPALSTNVPTRGRSGEPSSIHHTLLTEQQMRNSQAKWWRWLGEPSDAGGVIGRHAGGMYTQRGVWRPSRHSIMKSLGFAFDQVGRERMTQRIASRVNILQASTTGTTIGADRVIWVETLHPISHELDVTWTVNGTVRSGTGNARALDLRILGLSAGRHTVTARVVDPTPFVRDPAVRGSSALTRVRTWTVDTALTTPTTSQQVTFTASTPTNRPVGADDVVYVETTHPVRQVPQVTWRLDGSTVANPGNDRDLDLGSLGLSPGTHQLTASVTDPTAGTTTRTWTVDATPPQVTFQLSQPVQVITQPGQPTEYVFNGPFTMRLTGTDTTPGLVTSEFRLDGDGWHNYYGWPTDAQAPFRFTATGTNVDDLIYGNLGPGGLSLSPFAERPPGYGRHTINYRAIDAAGNISAAGTFVVTLLVP